MRRNSAAAGGGARRPPTERKPTDVRTREIIDVGARLFAQHGYAETSMRDICRAVGLTLGSLYYHVESKESVLVGIVTDTGEAFVDDMRRLCESDLPIEDCTRAIGRRWMREVHQHGDRWRVVMREQWRLREPRYREVMDLRRETERLIEDRLRRGIADGSVRDQDPRLTSMAISGLMNSTLQWYRPGARLDAESVADHFMALVLHGVRTSDSEAGDPALSTGNAERERRRHG